jgi:hypothetical protein
MGQAGQWSALAVLPGGRNFGQKSSKRAEEKQSWPEEFMVEFY